MELMRQEQWTRSDVLTRLSKGQMTATEARGILGLSKRQVRRLRRAFEARGRPSLVHGNTHRVPSNRLPTATQESVVRLYRAKYAGFNDQQFTEKLVDEGFVISRATVQRWLRAAKLVSPRKRRPPKHRQRRERKARSGMMILWDGSRHDWLQGRGPPMCLMGAVDDATSELLPGAHFVDQECSAGYLRTLRAIAVDKGLPCIAYMDRHGSLRRNDDHWTVEEQLRGEQDPTQVGLALRELGVQVIFALSPQAKGRVERLWGTLQDRLVSELRLAGTCTMAEANVVLERYRHDHNRRFAVAAADTASAWRPVRKPLDVDRVCSFRYRATVQNDNTVHLSGRIHDIPPGPRGRSYAKARVEVYQLLDGTWRIYAKERLIATAPATTVQEIVPLRQPKQSATTKAFRRAILDVAASLP